MRRVIGIVVPTYWEGKAMFNRYKFRPSVMRLFVADIQGHTVFVRISGVGALKAAKAAQTLVAAGAKELISFGFCGALVPGLHVGDLVTDCVMTSDRPACTPADREALRATANAVAVDMETRAVVETGTRLGVPIRVLRVISDEYSDDLTPLFGTSGKFSVFSIALRLLNPNVWPLAMKLRKQSKIASKSLAQALENHLS